MSEQYTISRANLLHVLTAERGTSEEDRRHIDAALKTALARFNGYGVRYTLSNAIWACADAGYPPSVDEIEALKRIDDEVSEALTPPTVEEVEALKRANAEAVNV